MINDLMLTFPAKLDFNTNIISYLITIKIINNDVQPIELVILRKISTQ